MPKLQELARFPGYYVDEDGNFYSQHFKRWGLLRSHAPRLLKTVLFTTGYKMARVTDGISEKRLSVAALVLESFVGPKPTDKHEVRHLDGNRQNNALSNLRWGTSKENYADKRRHGTDQIGSRNGQSKLTETDVLQVRTMLSTVTQRAVAKWFGVSQRAINFVSVGQHWKHI